MFLAARIALVHQRALDNFEHANGPQHGSSIPQTTTITTHEALRWPPSKDGRTGIEVASDNDSFHITGMGFVYLEHALIVRGADALRVHDNMIAECGNCVELTGAGQATIVSDNLMGAGPEGATLLAENHEGLLITGNNLFPRGRSLVELSGCDRCSVTSTGSRVSSPG